jgi:uncharacterized membrane protein YraQ (UPF0718 family)
MKGTAISLLLVLVGLIALALRQGRETFLLGVRTSVDQIVHFLPVLIVALFVAGFAETLLPKDLVETWLSDTSGWRGLVIAWLAGILTPGGGLIGLPLVAALYRAGVGVSVLMTYATSFFTLALLRLPLEVGFYGWRVTGLRWAVSLVLPFVAGTLTRLVLVFFKV